MHETYANSKQFPEGRFPQNVNIACRGKYVKGVVCVIEDIHDRSPLESYQELEIYAGYAKISLYPRHLRRIRIARNSIGRRRQSESL